MEEVRERKRKVRAGRDMEKEVKRERRESKKE
jgi:hypothetical protein